ncbi:MAG: glycosyl hydrolase 115 family protein [Eubacterium sp.]|nr:glycosyl hydrolase 115 family protein [Eubacterium sp.]
MSNNSIKINNSARLLFVRENEAFSGVIKISEKVMEDIRRVTGAATEALSAEEYKAEIAGGADGSDIYVIFGTIGKSPLLDEMQDRGIISLDEIKGKREVYGFFPVVTEEGSFIIIAGSDKRGTIYGLFHISDLLGVSPLVNWSLAVPVKKEQELSDKDTFISKEPSVLYRGFFINDEWPCFGNWCMKHFGGVNREAYEGIFEMLLRMKGNYLWPAMWASCFAEDGPGLLSAELADELGVVMGLSHHEPCLRHGEEYSHVRGKDSIYGDAWNFLVNKEGITRFWRDGLKRNGHLENVITVGMRGERDSKIMGKDATLKDNIDLLRDVLKTQNRLIKEEVNSDLTKVPRMLALYKEVEPFYYGNETTEGLKNCEELEDVILMLCDDNHGYLRTLPDESMRQHKGGFGMYYHFDYHGEPISYEWINSTYLPEVWEQMTTAYEHGVRSLWIVNVGDLGLNETPLSYFLSLAYDYDKYGINAVNSTKAYLRDWMQLQFGAAFDAEDIYKLTDVYNRANRLIHNRRPEHMNEDAYSLDRYEAEKVLEEAVFIKTAVLELEEKCPEDSKAAFTELISYNILAGINLIEMWIYRAYNHYFASIGAVVANDYAEKIKAALTYDAELAEKLQSAADRKWDGFAMAEHIGFRNWNSEESARPIIENVIPVSGPAIMAGLTGERASTGGMEWSGKPLTVREWRKAGDSDASSDTNKDDIFETRVFVALAGDKAVSYVAFLADGEYTEEPERNYVSTDSDSPLNASEKGSILDGWDIEIDRTSGQVDPENPIQYITVKTTRETLEKLSEKDDVHLYISYPQGRVDVRLLGYRKDVIEMPAEQYSFKSDGSNNESENMGEFVVLKDVGSWDSGVKLFPVTEDVPLTDSTPYLEYEFMVQEEGEYELIFQTLPANPYTAGENIFIKYSVNSLDTADVKTIKILPDDYQPGITDVWGDGVLSHVRYTKTLVSLQQGVNKVRYYAGSRENVLEKIILRKKVIEKVQKRIYG